MSTPLLLPAEGSFAWPPHAFGAAGLPAFSPGQVPARTTCQICGVELLFGSGATRLEAELRLCSSCPASEAERRALVRGMEAGLLLGCGADALPFEIYNWSPYESGTDLHCSWKLGWWAGLFAADNNPERAKARREIEAWLEMIYLSGAAAPGELESHEMSAGGAP